MLTGAATFSLYMTVGRVRTCILQHSAIHSDGSISYIYPQAIFHKRHYLSYVPPSQTGQNRDHHALDANEELRN